MAEITFVLAIKITFAPFEARAGLENTGSVQITFSNRFSYSTKLH